MGYTGYNLRSPWLVLDFETTARQDIDSFADDMRIDRRLTDPDKIAAAKANRIALAATDVDYARIVCTGLWASSDDGPIILAGDTEASERLQLETFWSLYKDIVINRGGHVVTFNGLTYDLPLAINRSRMLDVLHPHVTLNKYRSAQIIDLLGVLTHDWLVDRDKWKKLGVYCRLYGIHIPDATSGADMPALIAAGDWDAVRAHNLADLQRTQALAYRLGCIGPAACQQDDGRVVA